MRYDEIVAGVIDHPLRITVLAPRTRYVWPAAIRWDRHDVTTRRWARGSGCSADVDISGLLGDEPDHPRALKEHGAMLADNGSAWYMSGVPDERWDNDDLQRLGQVPGSAFDVIDVSAMKAAANSYQFGSSSTTTTTSTSTTSTTTTSTTVPPPPARSQWHLRGRQRGMDRDVTHEPRPRRARTHRPVDRPHDVHELG